MLRVPSRAVEVGRLHQTAVTPPRGTTAAYHRQQGGVMCTNSGLPPTSEHAAFLIHQKDEACSALFEACFPTPVDRPNFLTRLGNKAFRLSEGDSMPDSCYTFRARIKLGSDTPRVSEIEQSQTWHF